MNRKKLVSILIILLLWVNAFNLNAQNMTIRFADGVENTKLIGSLQKLTFVNNKLVINYISGTTDSFGLSTIGKLYFNPIANGIENQLLSETKKSMFIYPNPVNDVINLQNATEGNSTVSIYRMDGAMVLQTQISSESKSLNVTNLAKGIYLIRVNNQTLKFNKL